jgi:hypothetical protein
VRDNARRNSHCTPTGNTESSTKDQADGKFYKVKGKIKEIGGY